MVAVPLGGAASRCHPCRPSDSIKASGPDGVRSRTKVRAPLAGPKEMTLTPPPSCRGGEADHFPPDDQVTMRLFSGPAEIPRSAELPIYGRRQGHDLDAARDDGAGEGGASQVPGAALLDEQAHHAGAGAATAHQGLAGQEPDRGQRPEGAAPPATGPGESAPGGQLSPAGEVPQLVRTWPSSPGPTKASARPSPLAARAAGRADSPEAIRPSDHERAALSVAISGV